MSGFLDRGPYFLGDVTVVPILLNASALLVLYPSL